MKKQLILTLCSLLLYSAQAQDLQLDVHTSKLEDFTRWQQAQGGKRFKSDEYSITLPGMAQPQIFRSKEPGLPDRLSFCYYYTKDSTISSLFYEWDDRNFKGYKWRRRSN